MVQPFFITLLLGYEGVRENICRKSLSNKGNFICKSLFVKIS